MGIPALLSSGAGVQTPERLGKLLEIEAEEHWDVGENVENPRRRTGFKVLGLPRAKRACQRSKKMHGPDSSSVAKS